MLKPLEEFYCDTCGGLIETPKNGYLVFDSNEERKYHSFKIVHHQQRCITELPRSYSLERILSTDGLGILMSWVHLGSLEERDVSEVASPKEFAEFFKRLHLPYYEEARKYFSLARRDGMLDGNSIGWHSPNTLKDIIAEYSEED